MQWYPVSNTLHVTRIITDSWNMPVLLRSEIIDHLKSVEADGLWDEVTPVEVLRKKFNDSNGELMVAPAEYEGMIGKLVSIDDKGRARVLLDMLGQVSFTVDGRTLRVVQG